MTELQITAEIIRSVPGNQFSWREIKCIVEQAMFFVYVNISWLKPFDISPQFPCLTLMLQYNRVISTGKYIGAIVTVSPEISPWMCHQTLWGLQDWPHWILSMIPTHESSRYYVCYLPLPYVLHVCSRDMCKFGKGGWISMYLHDYSWRLVVGTQGEIKVFPFT